MKLTDMATFDGGVELKPMKVNDEVLIHYSQGTKKVNRPHQKLVEGYEFNPILLSRDTAYLRTLLDKKRLPIQPAPTIAVNVRPFPSEYVDIRAIARTTLRELPSDGETPEYTQAPPLAKDVSESLKHIYNMQSGFERARFENDVTRDGIKDRREHLRSVTHDAQMHTNTRALAESLSGVHTTLESLWAYKARNTDKWQTDMLEQQFRQTYLITELNTLQKAALEISHRQNEAIIYNTGLPEGMKSTPSQRWGIWSEKALHDLYSHMFYHGLYPRAAAINQAVSTVGKQLLTRGFKSAQRAFDADGKLKDKAVSIAGSIRDGAGRLFGSPTRTPTAEGSGQSPREGLAKRLLGIKDEVVDEYGKVLDSKLGFDADARTAVIDVIPTKLDAIYQAITNCCVTPAKPAASNTSETARNNPARSTGGMREVNTRPLTITSPSQYAPAPNSASAKPRQLGGVRILPPAIESAIAKVAYTSAVNNTASDSKDINLSSLASGMASSVDLLILQKALRDRTITPELRDKLRAVLVTASRQRVHGDRLVDTLTNMDRSTEGPITSLLSGITGGAGGVSNNHSSITERLSSTSDGTAVTKASKQRNGPDGNTSPSEYADAMVTYLRHIRNILLRVNAAELGYGGLAFLDTTSPEGLIAVRGSKDLAGKYLNAHPELPDDSSMKSRLIRLAASAARGTSVPPQTAASGSTAGASSTNTSPSDSPSPGISLPGGLGLPPGLDLASAKKLFDRDFLNGSDNKLLRGWGKTLSIKAAIDDSMRRNTSFITKRILSPFNLWNLANPGSSRDDDTTTPPPSAGPSLADRLSSTVNQGRDVQQAASEAVRGAATPLATLLPRLPNLTDLADVGVRTGNPEPTTLPPPTPTLPSPVANEPLIPELMPIETKVPRGMLPKSALYRSAVKMVGIQQALPTVVNVTAYERVMMRRATEQVGLLAVMGDRLDKRLEDLAKKSTTSSSSGEDSEKSGGLLGMAVPAGLARLLPALAPAIPALAGAAAFGGGTYLLNKAMNGIFGEEKAGEIKGAMQESAFNIMPGGMFLSAMHNKLSSWWSGEDGKMAEPPVATGGVSGGTPTTASGDAVVIEFDPTMFHEQSGKDALTRFPLMVKEFQHSLMGLAYEFHKITGNKLKLNMSIRTSSEQAVLHARDPVGAAPPGRSLHEYRLAVDVSNALPPKALDKCEELGLLRKYGLWRPISGERHHLEAIGIHPYIKKIKDRTMVPEQMAAHIVNSRGRGGGGSGSGSGYPTRSDEEYQKLWSSGKSIGTMASMDTGTQPTAEDVLTQLSMGGTISRPPPGPYGNTQGMMTGEDGAVGDAPAMTSSLSEKEAYIVRKMQTYGWTKNQAAGMAANFKGESTYDHKAVGDGGKAYGLAQWHPDRQADFKKFAGKDIRSSTMDEQLAFVNHELTAGKERGAGKKLRATSTASEAAASLVYNYERPADKPGEAAKRGRYAEQIAKSAPSSSVSPMAPPPTPASMRDVAKPDTSTAVTPASIVTPVGDYSYRSGPVDTSTPPSAKKGGKKDVATPVNKPVAPKPAADSGFVKTSFHTPPPVESRPAPPAPTPVYDKPEIKGTLETSLSVQRNMLSELQGINAKLAALTPKPVTKAQPTVLKDTAATDAVNVTI